MKIKKIHLAFLITTLLILGGGLIYARGGGPGPWESAGNEKFIQQKPEALPAVCKVEPLKTPDPTIKQQPNVCTVEFPEQLQVVPYCINKSNKLGAANITIPSMGLIHYKNLPKNCYVLVNEETLSSRTIVCSGPAGSKVNLVVENSCTPPDAGLPVQVKPSCPPDFKMNPLGGCELQVPKNAPSCPNNTVFLASQNCCMDDKYYWTVNGINGGIHACPEGYLTFPTEVPGVEENTYEKTVNCVRESSLINNTRTHTYTITLGSCNITNNNNTDQFAPGTIDPSTGTCK